MMSVSKAIGAGVGASGTAAVLESVEIPSEFWWVKLLIMLVVPFATTYFAPANRV